MWVNGIDESPSGNTRQPVVSETPELGGLEGSHRFWCRLNEDLQAVTPHCSTVRMVGLSDLEVSMATSVSAA